MAKKSKSKKRVVAKAKRPAAKKSVAKKKGPAVEAQGESKGQGQEDRRRTQSGEEGRQSCAQKDQAQSQAQGKGRGAADSGTGCSAARTARFQNPRHRRPLPVRNPWRFEKSPEGTLRRVPALAEGARRCCPGCFRVAWGLLTRQEKAQGEGHGDDGNDDVESHADMRPISGGHHRGVQVLGHLAELPCGNQSDRSAQQQQQNTDAEREAALWTRDGLVSHHLQEQAETLDDESEAHQGYGAALPGEQVRSAANSTRGSAVYGMRGSDPCCEPISVSQILHSDALAADRRGQAAS